MRSSEQIRRYDLGKLLVLLCLLAILFALSAYHLLDVARISP